jgi:hypothetical protein
VTDAGSDIDAVLAFNDAINARELAALTALMTDDHRFVDSAGATVDGKAAASKPGEGSSPRSRLPQRLRRRAEPCARRRRGDRPVGVLGRGAARPGPMARSSAAAVPPSGRSSARIEGAFLIVVIDDEKRTDFSRRPAAVDGEHGAHAEAGRVDARKRIASAISPGCARRPIGIIWRSASSAGIGRRAHVAEERRVRHARARSSAHALVRVVQRERASGFTIAAFDAE